MFAPLYSIVLNNGNYMTKGDKSFSVFVSKGEKPIPAERLARLAELIEPWFIFSLVWSVGTTGDHESQIKFSNWMRETMKQEGVRNCIILF